MWNEMMGEEIDQIVILISSEDGANQVFVKQPVDYVRELKRAMEIYNASKLPTTKASKSLSGRIF